MTDVYVVFAVIAAGIVAQLVVGVVTGRRKWPRRKTAVAVGSIGFFTVEVIVVMLNLGVWWLLGGGGLLVLIYMRRVAAVEAAVRLGSARRAAEDASHT